MTFWGLSRLSRSTDRYRKQNFHYDATACGLLSSVLVSAELLFFFFVKVTSPLQVIVKVLNVGFCRVFWFCSVLFFYKGYFPFASDVKVLKLLTSVI